MSALRLKIFAAMHAIETKREHTRWLKLREALIWFCWAALTSIAWFASVVDVKGMYPDWDDRAGQIFSLFIRGILIVAWCVWIFWFLSGRSKKVYSWFRLGVCFALLLAIVRDFFMAVVVKLLHL